MGQRLLSFEIEVEMTVRRKMIIDASDDDMAAIAVMKAIAAARQGQGGLSSFLKWTDGRRARRPMPVEKIIADPSPMILSVKPRIDPIGRA